MNLISYNYYLKEAQKLQGRSASDDLPLLIKAPYKVIEFIINGIGILIKGVAKLAYLITYYTVGVIIKTLGAGVYYTIKGFISLVKSFLKTIAPKFLYKSKSDIYYDAVVDRGENLLKTKKDVVKMLKDLDKYKKQLEKVHDNLDEAYMCERSFQRFMKLSEQSDNDPFDRSVKNLLGEY